MMKFRRSVALVLTAVAISLGIAAAASPAQADTSWGAFTDTGSAVTK